jgi:hypothetical protein
VCPLGVILVSWMLFCWDSESGMRSGEGAGPFSRVKFFFQDLLVQAARSPNTAALLAEADLELDRLRLYIRLSHARHLTSPDQYQFAAERLTEIGRLLGGWLKSLPAKHAPAA